MFVLNITKITLAWELFEAGVPKAHIASRLGLQRETVHLWIKGILEYGLIDFIDRYSKAKKGPRIKRRVDPILKRGVWAPPHLQPCNINNLLKETITVDGILESERWTVVDRRSYISWKKSMGCLRHCPRCMKSWQKSMS